MKDMQQTISQLSGFISALLLPAFVDRASTASSLEKLLDQLEAPLPFPGPVKYSNVHCGQKGECSAISSSVMHI
jgi:hypothetical protein